MPNSVTGPDAGETGAELLRDNRVRSPASPELVWGVEPASPDRVSAVPVHNARVGRAPDDVSDDPLIVSDGRVPELARNDHACDPHSTGQRPQTRAPDMCDIAPVGEESCGAGVKPQPATPSASPMAVIAPRTVSDSRWRPLGTLALGVQRADL